MYCVAFTMIVLNMYCLEKELENTILVISYKILNCRRFPLMFKKQL